MLDPVTLSVNGQQFGGWETVKVEASADDAKRSFTVTTSERKPDWPIQPGDQVDVLVNGSDIIVSGYVEDYDANLDGSHHTASISGSSKSVDLCDCAAIHDTGRFRNATIKDIGDAISKDYGVKINDKTKNGLNKLERFQIQNGETVFDALERIARTENLFLVGAADGSLEIHDGPEGISAISLVEGFPPLLAISVKLSMRDRHQTYKVRGQRAHTPTATDLEIEATSTDGAVKRKRTRIIHAEGDIDPKRAQKRVDNEKQTQQGRSITASASCSGFYAPTGELWRPLMQVYVYAPTVHIDQTMGIKDVTWSKSATHQTQTELALVDPKALKSAEGDSRSKSGSAYSQD